jgi:hypothetical protein
LTCRMFPAYLHKYRNPILFRFERVSMPSEFGQENDDLTKDYTGPAYQACKR